MANILANSMLEKKRIKSLLKESVPSYRQAYSDKTAWLMACVSELAYLRFNPLFSKKKQKDYFLKNISKLVNENKKSSLLKLIDMVGYDHNKEKKKLEAELDIIDMKLIESFDTEGTQAILVSFNDHIVLAFRGTEAKSIKDIKTDAKAKPVPCVTKGKVHFGFKKAYEQVENDIQEKLDEDKFKEKPLFITGHSLGGALATIAAKRLTHKGGLAACYTFGSPRVGDAEWITNIKTPIYRLVNAADCVTMLPPSSEAITLISWLLKFIPQYGKPLRKLLLSNLRGYIHCGNMRYLTNCQKDQYENVKLLYSVSIFYRIKGFLVKKSPFTYILADHSKSIYRKKLEIIARNEKS